MVKWSLFSINPIPNGMRIVVEKVGTTLDTVVATNNEGIFTPIEIKDTLLQTERFETVRVKNLAQSALTGIVVSNTI